MIVTFSTQAGWLGSMFDVRCSMFDIKSHYYSSFRILCQLIASVLWSGLFLSDTDVRYGKENKLFIAQRLSNPFLTSMPM